MTAHTRARGEGSIYPLLGRLEREGLVETQRVEIGGVRPRKYYSASPAGKQALAAGLADWQSARDAVDAVLGLREAEVHA